MIVEAVWFCGLPEISQQWSKKIGGSSTDVHRT